MDLHGKKVILVGIGRTTTSLARLLIREGAEPFLTDAAPAEKVAHFLEQLDALGVGYECGGHTDAAFRNAALVVPSPGVDPRLPFIEAAGKAGAEVLGEMEVAFSYCRSPILAVTGTNGKTTTTELLHCLVSACGHSVLLAGNNDMPLSEAAQFDPVPDFIVQEVSSYQLETMRTWRPWIGVVLNVTPDHLGRHGALERYAAVKERMFANQGPDDVAVVNYDDPFVRAMASRRAGRVVPFSIEQRLDTGLWLNGEVIRAGAEIVAMRSDIQLPGRHNLANVLAALAMMRAGGFDWEQVLSGLRSFRGVEHRIEPVCTIDGVGFYNDSKSTNIESLKAALESFDRPVVLIAGGQGKGSDYRVLRGLVSGRVRYLVTIGADAPLLAAAFGDCVPVEHASDMEDAVRRAAARAEPGDAVLLSPACASFDMFSNFEQRGRVFKEAVKRYERMRP
jgi:UDP-N-acetylmuramoylalanine--D-glutamate ligase